MVGLYSLDFAVAMLQSSSSEDFSTMKSIVNSTRLEHGACDLLYGVSDQDGLSLAGYIKGITWYPGIDLKRLRYTFVLQGTQVQLCWI